MTYQELLDKLMSLSPEQLKMTATVELEYENECFPLTDLRICGEEHFCLDEDHPVLFVLEW